MDSVLGVFGTSPADLQAEREARLVRNVDNQTLQEQLDDLRTETTAKLDAILELLAKA
jgi:hypothetical protein